MTEDSELDLLLQATVEECLAQQRTPCAVYRLQFGPALGFRAALALVPYLDDLGISDCYTSPLFKSCSDDGGGYDICDPGQLNPTLGRREDFDALAAALQECGMGLLLDVVPNHMGIARGNAWWDEVLENGPGSPYAEYFDINWRPAKPELADKVLLPVLEGQYGTVLESGKLALQYEQGAFFVNYYETRLPLSPSTYDQILGDALTLLLNELEERNECVQELASIITAIRHLPGATDTAVDHVAERAREKEVIKRRLAALCDASPSVPEVIQEVVARLNGAASDPQSFDLLDNLLGQQCYRPAFWRVSTEEINYRRFFDIDKLAAVRTEQPQVFAALHALVFELVEAGQVTGLRVDHPDGLRDPSSYFTTLQAERVLRYARRRLAEISPEAAAALQDAQVRRTLDRYRADHPGAGWPLYVIAEKILAEGEELPQEWAVCGTTGYDFLNLVNGLLVDGSNHKAMDRVYSRFTRLANRYADVVNGSKKMIMLVAMSSEVNALSHRLSRIAEKNRRYRDFTLNGLTHAIREVIAALPIYRTYVDAATRLVPDRDRSYIQEAVDEAAVRNPRTSRTIFDFIRDTLLLDNLEEFPEPDRGEVAEFVMHFQQLSSPVMAKGVEDTAFYTYNRLVSLNEVGGRPAHFGRAVADFHRENETRRQHWPHSLLTTSTHDTKRSEDVRARLAVLSELPVEWWRALSRWSRRNAGKKTLIDGEGAPSRNDEYLLYQTLLGAWPEEEKASFAERIDAYMLKAVKEAKVHTSWINANEVYETALHDFISRVLADEEFLAAFRPLQQQVAFYGRFNSLAQLVLKLTAPGVPDIYQGTELWDLSLVDPDNRRPVDFARRQALLAELRERESAAGEGLLPLAVELLEHAADGRIKLYILERTLNWRREHADLFQQGAYLPLEARGEKAQHVVALARILEEAAILAVVPRLALSLTSGNGQAPVGGVWGDTRLLLPAELAGKRYRNLFTGEDVDAGQELKVGSVLGHFPVAVMVKC